MTASSRCTRTVTVKVGALSESDAGAKRASAHLISTEGCRFNGRDHTPMPNATDSLIYCSPCCDNWAGALGASTAASQQREQTSLVKLP